MRFDIIIGNPPYQGDFSGQSAKMPPLYHLFLEEAFRLNSLVFMIHPGRFLYRAGATPKDWDDKMLNDPFYSVSHYFHKSADVFPETDIKGGVAITRHFSTIEQMEFYLEHRPDDEYNISSRLEKAKAAGWVSILSATT